MNDELIRKYLRKFVEVGSPVDIEVLRDLVDWPHDLIVQKYSTGGIRRLMSIQTFERLLASETLEEYFVGRTLEKLNYETTNKLSSATFELLQSLDHINNSDLNSDLGEVVRKFSNVVVLRNEMAMGRGYSSYLDLQCRQHVISSKDLDDFYRRVDGVIANCVSHAPEYVVGGDCPLCKIRWPDLRFPNTVVDLVKSKYADSLSHLSEFQIEDADQDSTRFDLISGKFVVRLNRELNARHRSVILAHELGHVVSMSREFSSDRLPLESGRYKVERDATAIEMDLIKALGDDVYRARLYEYLTLIFRGLFEIEIYTNSKVGPVELYKSMFKRCFGIDIKGGGQNFLFDKWIVHRPLASLPQVMAVVANMGIAD